MHLTTVIIGTLVTVLSVASVNSYTIIPKHEVAKDWYEYATFYQIYPRSFQDSDGDGVGDIKGIISRLEHLADLGVTATWLSPIFKSPMADFGYDIEDFKAVDPIFGTMADMEALFARANELNIKIILDFVPNHSSDQCEWFKQSILRNQDFDEFYIWHSGKEPLLPNGRPSLPNNWNSVFRGPAWTWNEARGQYYLHQFAKEQPDLNFRNPKVIEAMSDVLVFWLDKGAHGFRVDAINHMFEYPDFRDEPLNEWDTDPLSYGYTHKDYTKDLNETYDVIYDWRKLLDDYTLAKGGPSRIMMTEAYANTTYTMKYYQSDDGLTPGAHMPFNFVLINELWADSNANRFLEVITDRIGVIPEGKVTNWVIGNHDQARVGSRYPGRVDALLMLVMTLPGIAVTYMGEEIGMLDNRDGITFEQTVDPQGCNQGPEHFKDASRDPVRTPYQWDSTKWAGFSTASDAVGTWLPVHPNYVTLNLASQKTADRSYYKYYKNLMEIRKNHVFIDGDFKPKVVNQNVLAYSRTLAEHGGTYVVLINLGEDEQTVKISDITSEYEANEFVQIVIAGADSQHREESLVLKDEIVLQKYDALLVTGGANGLSISFGLLVLAAVLKFIIL